MKSFLSALLLCCAVLAVHAKRTRINNKGETASPGEFPFQVSITEAGHHFCGGALISKSHVLTAAHCIEEFVKPGGYQLPLAVEVGSVVLGKGKSHAIKRLSYRQGFTKQNHLFLPNDVAVVHLKTPVELSANVATIALPTANSEIPEGTLVIVTGFGSSKFNGDVSYLLKKLEIKTVSIAKCQGYQARIIQKTNICAARGPGYGTCTGDSGGPMVDATKKTIVGIVSGGNGMCGSGSPDVFTKVSHFVSYIKEEMSYDVRRTKGLPSMNPAIDLDKSNALNPGGSFNPFPQSHFPQIPGRLPSNDGLWGGFYPKGQLQGGNQRFPERRPIHRWR